MKRIGLMGLIGLMSLMGLIGCSNEKSPEEQAMDAAKEAATECYNNLLAGKYEQFLDARVGADSMPADYRTQLIASYKQYIALQKEHEGIASFEVSNVQIDSVSQLIEVFLLLHYGDNSQEEIVVPMVEHNGMWRMK